MLPSSVRGGNALRIVLKVLTSCCMLSVNESNRETPKIIHLGRHMVAELGDIFKTSYTCLKTCPSYACVPAPSILTFPDTGYALHIRGHDCSRDHRRVQKLVEDFFQNQNQQQQQQEMNNMKSKLCCLIFD